MGIINLNTNIEKGWRRELSEEFAADYFAELSSILGKEFSQSQIYPKEEDIFKAFDLCPFDKVKVVILGQDPYHGPSQAHGLCFSVPKGIIPPPSLKNIFKEIQNDLGYPMPESGDLSNWAKQGVFLLNTYLTVRQSEPLSHAKIGWERFTDAAIKALSDKKEGLIFLLWGNNASKKKTFIDLKKHFVLESVHPSPLSAHRGFMGCGHFSKTNEILQKMNRSQIDWKIK